MTGPLTHSPADVIRTLLIDLSLGTDPDDGDSWPAYVAHMPDSPDSAVMVTDTTARQGGRCMITGERQEHEGVQVMVRDANHADGYAKARAIAVAMDTDVDHNYVVIGVVGYRVYSITRTTSVIALGKDVSTSKRDIFTVNAVVAMRQTT